MPGPGVELIGAEETAEVLEVMSSGFLSRYGPSDNPAFGAKVHRIEERDRRAWPACATASGLSGGGSAALWIALLGLGVGAGDEVIVPGFTFVASISAIVYTGATPVLAEVDRVVRPRPGRRRGEDHPADGGDPRRPHARRSGPDDRAQGGRRPPRHPHHRGLRPGVRGDLQGRSASAASGRSGRTASTSTRRSPAATAA